MTPTDSAIERGAKALHLARYGPKGSRWESDSEAYRQRIRGWIRAVLIAAYPQGEPHGQHRDLLDEVYGRVEAENDLPYGERR